MAVTRAKLDFGDYAAEGSNVSVDTKRSVDEVAQNLVRDHARFRRECERARDAGWRLVVLIENGTYSKPSELHSWTPTHCRLCGFKLNRKCNPKSGGICIRHRKRKPAQGAQIARAMKTMSERYGVKFEFCKPADAAMRICELLGVEYDADGADGDA